MVKCESVAGFAGHTCQLNIDDCVGQPCLNGATCEDAVNAYICHCHKGKISTHAKFSSLIRFYDNWNRQWLTFWATLHICVIVSVFQACDSRKARPKNKQWLKCHFRAQELWQKNWGSHALWWAPIGRSGHDNGPLKLCLAYIPSRRFLSSVTSRPLYDDHHHHSTAERTFPYNYGSVGPSNACNQYVEARNGFPMHSPCFNHYIQGGPKSKPLTSHQ